MPSESDSPPAEFGDLVRAYYTPLYRFAYSLTGNASEASDLTQKVSIAITAEWRSDKPK